MRNMLSILVYTTLRMLKLQLNRKIGFESPNVFLE